jgi:hypothetical protein
MMATPIFAGYFAHEEAKRKEKQMNPPAKELAKIRPWPKVTPLCYSAWTSMLSES